ncbi:molybdopterin molybdotransferase MoeA [Neogemmobacter tilapiae]|uniref:Molybdopterin molybdenumtransferase n=1 Tax=Neogemmobacter tilapiae TaxID=875041 RepID=A0A918TSQ9_9RHOB|nr:gephyrin-like molybdotransferase Glp [Gemmobacter tilapiae]GHC60830.1 molybdopterin molybdenumtransferase MoeA [Gemmobacter tilapiae]
MMPVGEAQAKVLGLALALPVEHVALADAAGRWLAEAVQARRDQPPFDASAMDGYAIAGDAEEGMTFHVVGEAGAGHHFAGTVGPDQAVRIFTGAPVPRGALRVVLQEDVTREGDNIRLNAPATGATHIRPQGNDFSAGQSFAPKRLTANDVALLAAMNLPRLPCRRRPVVAMIATGDELVMPGGEPGPDQIVCSNTFALKAMAEAEGAKVRMLPIARDTVQDLRKVVELAQGADVIVTVGGASVGDHDLVGQVTADLGMERAFYKVAMRPGKPLMAGRLGDAVMLGLPGNPVSAIVCGHLFLLPLLRALQGAADPLPVAAEAVLAEDVAPTGPRTHYMRARVEAGADLPILRPFADQDSALLGVLSQANALLIRPLGDAARRAGDRVSYLPI